MALKDNSKLKIWVDATRPKTLPASIIPVIAGTAIAGTETKISWFLFMVIISTALAIQLTTNFVNDLYDHLKGADNEERKGPVRATQAGLVSPEEMRKASIFSVLASLLLGSYLVWQGGWPIAAIGILSIIFAIAYTAGPLPLAYLGLGDIFVFIFFGPVAVAGTTYLFTGDWKSASILTGCALGSISMAILTVNNLRDYDSDKSALKKTLVVRFGKAFGKMEYIASIMFAALIPALLFLRGHTSFWVITASASLLLAIPLIKNVLKERDLNNTLAGTGKLLVIFGIIFSIAWVFGR